MEKEDIPFNYFLVMFNKNLHKRILDDEDIAIIMPQEEGIKILSKSFYEVLVMYLTLTDNNEFTILPAKSVDLLRLILSDITKNKYSESLLKSVQFIIAKYLEILGKGYPTIMSSDDKTEERVFKVIYNRNQRINTFDSTNMSLEEQDVVMTKILKNVLENKEELMPSVRFMSRTDI